MSTTRLPVSEGATRSRRVSCEYSYISGAPSAQANLPRHCVDADNTYDVSLSQASEDHSAHEKESDEAHEEDSRSDDDHASGIESAAASDITEVTGCHAVADSLYCSGGGAEWKVTTDVDIENAPNSYSGCDSHGADEL